MLCRLELLADGHEDGVVRGLVRHRGRTRWLWEVESRDDQSRLCAITIVKIAARDRRPG
jgi:acyl-coenzyme A thioesterase PaaI-like protein